MASTIALNTVHEKALKGLDALPPFSPILNRLLATLADEDVSFAKVAALIEKDTVLAGNVLRLVNSPLYGCRGTINSVAHAIAIMGIVKLRNVALGLSVSRMWRGVRCAGAWSMANFNLHSIGTAILADLLAQRVPVHYAEGAFVCGLFHDLGRLLLAVSLPGEYETVLQGADVHGPELEVREREIMGVSHADLSAMALELWNLPRPIQVGAAFHHDPGGARPDAYEECRYTLAHVVCVADQVVNALGIGVVKRERAECPPDAEMFKLVGLEDRYEAALEDFAREYENVRSLF